MINAKIMPTKYPNFLVPKNIAIKNLTTVFDIDASVIAVTATSGVMVFLARIAILMVMASTSATPDMMLVI